MLASSVALFLLVFFYLACYRLPTPKEFIEHESTLYPSLKELKIERYDEDLYIIWYSHVTIESNNKVTHEFAIELSPKWVLPFQNYYDKE
ncbi:MAG: hypothetical protein D3910_16450 [Candidatus Electrothrix sp. ATG2]|nr:hypothetical protein [Candidatus Electrothrix sp. ATG2]